MLWEPETTDSALTVLIGQPPAGGEGLFCIPTLSLTPLYSLHQVHLILLRFILVHLIFPYLIILSKAIVWRTVNLIKSLLTRWKEKRSVQNTNQRYSVLQIADPVFGFFLKPLPASVFLDLHACHDRLPVCSCCVVIYHSLLGHIWKEDISPWYFSCWLGQVLLHSQGFTPAGNPLLQDEAPARMTECWPHLRLSEQPSFPLLPAGTPMPLSLTSSSHPIAFFFHPLILPCVDSQLYCLGFPPAVSAAS